MSEGAGPSSAHFFKSQVARYGNQDHHSNCRNIKLEYMALQNAPDLTTRPPRSPRVRLGGFVLLPRILDKCRAVIAGTNGEFNYNCPSDQLFFDFTGVNPAALKKQVQLGKGDGEILAWIKTHSKHNRTDSEIMAWSAYCEGRTPGNIESREFFHETHRNIAPRREDIITWFDLLDLDDYASFGGKP